MQPEEMKAEPLKKIRMSIQSSKEQPGPSSKGQSGGKFVQPPFETAFIIGLATDGMCPFEYRLLDKTKGDRFFFELKHDEISDTFGHIEVPVDIFPQHAETFYVIVAVLDVADVGQKEIVHSMAEVSKRGGGCCDHCAG